MKSDRTSKYIIEFQLFAISVINDYFYSLLYRKINGHFQNCPRNTVKVFISVFQLFNGTDFK